MKNPVLAVLILFFWIPIFAQSQPAEQQYTPQDYIDMYKESAIREMHLSGVPASITLAQGMLESGNGNSALARYANNHFGIKCHAGWEGPTFIQDDDEKNECFRKYKSVFDSYKDHSEFLKTRDRYAFLFELALTDYKGWAHGLKQAGYATNPKYPHLLITIIERHELYKYDLAERIPEEAQKPTEVQRKKDKLAKKEKTPKSNQSAEEAAIAGGYKLSANNIKYYVAKKGDSAFKIATKFNMGLWQVLKYNDLSKSDIVREGDIIYLQPKRSKAKEEFHFVRKGETMYDISQQHGIKLRTLYKKNRMEIGEQPQQGDKLYLRKKAPAVQ